MSAPPSFASDSQFIWSDRDDPEHTPDGELHDPNNPSWADTYTLNTAAQTSDSGTSFEPPGASKSTLLGRVLTRSAISAQGNQSSGRHRTSQTARTSSALDPTTPTSSPATKLGTLRGGGQKRQRREDGSCSTKDVKPVNGTLSRTDPDASMVPLFPGIEGSVMLPNNDAERYEYLDGQRNPRGWKPMRTWSSGGTSTKVKTEAGEDDTGIKTEETDAGDDDGPRYEYLEGKHIESDHPLWKGAW